MKNDFLFDCIVHHLTQTVSQFPVCSEPKYLGTPLPYTTLSYAQLTELLTSQPLHLPNLALSPPARTSLPYRANGRIPKHRPRAGYTRVEIATRWLTKTSSTLASKKRWMSRDS